ncbi:hypothetical protein V6N13_148984 [Hibiscus sabdariffa]
MYQSVRSPLFLPTLNPISQSPAIFFLSFSPHLDRVFSMVEAPAPMSPDGGSHESGGEQSPRSNVQEQDRYLPIVNITRLMKKALPANGKIAKDAKETVQEHVSKFINFITSEYELHFPFLVIF